MRFGGGPGFRCRLFSPKNLRPGITVSYDRRDREKANAVGTDFRQGETPSSVRMAKAPCDRVIIRKQRKIHFRSIIVISGEMRFVIRLGLYDVFWVRKESGGTEVV